MNQYVAAFRHVEAARLGEARIALKEIATTVSQRVVPDQQSAISKAVDGQLAKLA